MSELNIWLLQTGEPLPVLSGVRKLRTALLSDKLLERGHTVYWWASAFEHQRKVMLSDRDRVFKVSQRFSIRVLRGCGYRKNISIARYLDHYILAYKFRIQARNFVKPDVIVASMPCHLFAFEAARYARKNSIPFLVDIRDLWPDIFLNYFKNKRLYGLGRIVLAPDFIRLSMLLKKTDALVAVSKGYLQWGLDKFRGSRSSLDRVFYHGYKINSKKAESVNDKSDIYRWLKGRDNQKLFVFIGTFGVSYELELILNAARRFSKSGITDICFVLAGTGEQADLIRKKASKLQNVVLPGWINIEEIEILLKNGYVGLVPCRSVENTLPNKPFEYLSFGLPLINSLEGEMAELIERHRIGMSYLPGDAEGFYRCVQILASDSRLRDQMSSNASQFFKEYGDADKIYAEYAEHIERLVEYKKHANSTERS